VLRALAERRARGDERSAVAPDAGGGPAAGHALGPSEIVVSREVGLEIDRVRQALRRFLRRHLLVTTHEEGDRAEWRRAQGLWDGIVRSLGFRRRYLLASASRVETTLVPIDEHRTDVTLRLDLTELRRSRLLRLGGEAGAAFVLLGVGGAWLAPGFGLTDVLALLGGGGFAGTIYALERRLFDVQRAEIARVPRRFLESLERRGERSS
jgi:hypothetical protein